MMWDTADSRDGPELWPNVLPLILALL